MIIPSTVVAFFNHERCILLDVSEEVSVPLWVKKGTLKFPKDMDTPVIMVGPGTGVAPFRSAIQERIAEGKTGEAFVSEMGIPQLSHLNSHSFVFAL